MARVLLIEDDVEIAVLLERYLTRVPHTVVRCSDGAAGVAAFLAAPFDLVLTDALLPKRSGFDVVSDVRALAGGKTAAIIMMSAAYKGAQAKRDATARGADAFFVKPFVLGELRRTIDQLLHERMPVQVAEPAVDLTSKAAPKAVVLPTQVIARQLRPRSRTVPATRELRDIHDCAQLLLTCARAGFNGVVRFDDQGSLLELVFANGVPVGASDNLREHLLGERMWRQRQLTTDQMRALNQRIAQRGERIAEALLALAYCTADEAFIHVEEQVSARVRRAITWTGVATTIASDTSADPRAIKSIELPDVILAFAFEPSQQAVAHDFVVAHGASPVEKHPRFEELLHAFARVRPQSTLPMLLMSQSLTVAECAMRSGPADVFALHLAGIVRLPDDDAHDQRPLPDILRSVPANKLVDRDAARRLCEVLLRARASDYYALVGLPRDAASLAVRAALEALVDEVGKEKLRGVPLGPAAAAAGELWELLEVGVMTFGDPAARAAYDASMTSNVRPVAGSASHSAEDDYLSGQQALADGAIETALVCFTRACAQRPNDADYASYRSWALILNNDEAAGKRGLVDAASKHPQAMRPVFFMGLNAARLGDLDRARALLLECKRRCPDDVEVHVTLASLS